MSKFASFLGGNVVVASGAAVAAIVAVIVVATGVFRSPDPQPEPVVAAPVTSTPETVAPVETETPAETKEPVPEPETETVAKPAPETEPEAAPVIAEPAPVPPSIAPTFDLVRVEPDGRTLVAGIAAPGVEISIILDRDEVAVTSTDASGKFVSFLNIEASDKARVMSLVQKGEGGLASEATVIIAATPVVIASVVEPEQEPTSTPVEETAVETATTEDTSVAPTEEPAAESAATQPSAVATAEVPEQAETTETTETTETAEATETPVTTTVLLKDPSGVTVMQAPNEASPEVMSTVALDAISYSEAGEVQLSGRSGQEGFVRVYLDNTPVTTSRIEEDGNWRMELPDVDTGVYTLRVDEVAKDGTVVSRVETPFKREDQETLKAATEDAVADAQVVTVQPGSTLWAIADERYGDGVMYVRVFDANRDRIRDPDLIYPGQVFALPEN
ncbi:LysM domain-containing protein [Shimia gijangensis]|uniref:LysM domain-containing protein n=1 Tax=Shimia gijangensis TaxID=1470563 RepID=A0A1M6E781_9RHOB|nr:LysM peptidoglycan-binding domain-containing protein [Shimia gijangensis]SHI81346.1 LysM domain-containing protein [Shimia gijangensis]